MAKQPLWGGALRLMTVTLAAGLLLGGVYAVTQPIIERRRAEWLKETLQAVCPGDSYEEITPPEITDKNVIIEAVYKVNPTGLIILATTKGYGGEFTLAIGYKNNSTKIHVLNHNETAGIGTKWFERLEKDQPVDAISGATVTGDAIKRAINAAEEVYRGQ